MRETQPEAEILTYDAAQVLLRYLKKWFPNCSFINFSAEEDYQIDLEQFDFIVYVVEGEIHINEFFKLLNSKIKIVFMSSLTVNPEEITDFKSWFDIKFININSTKREIKEQFKFHLDQHQKRKTASLHLYHEI